MFDSSPVTRNNHVEYNQVQLNVHLCDMRGRIKNEHIHRITGTCTGTIRYSPVMLIYKEVC